MKKKLVAIKKYRLHSNIKRLLLYQMVHLPLFVILPPRIKVWRYDYICFKQSGTYLQGLSLSQSVTVCLVTSKVLTFFAQHPTQIAKNLLKRRCTKGLRWVGSWGECWKGKFPVFIGVSEDFGWGVGKNETFPWLFVSNSSNNAIITSNRACSVRRILTASP